MVIAAVLVPLAARAADVYGLTPPTADQPLAGDPQALPALPLAGDPQTSPALPPAVNTNRPMLGVPATSEAFERASLCLTNAIYYEAGAEPRAGQEAVAQVVINRLHRPGFPKTVCGVVFQGAERTTGCQFTFACDGSLSRPPDLRAWAQAREVAVDALQDGPVNHVGDSTHYHASWMTPYWRSSMQETARIGGHIFYRPFGPDRGIAAASLQYAGVEPAPSFAQAASTAVAVVPSPPARRPRRGLSAVRWVIVPPSTAPGAAASKVRGRLQLANIVPPDVAPKPRGGW